MRLSSVSIRAALCALLCASMPANGHAQPPSGAVPSNAPSPSKKAPISIVDAAKYRAMLESARSQMQRMETGKAPRRGLEALLKTLSKPERLRLRRSDGATQLAGNDHWARMAASLETDPLANDRGAPVKRVDVTQARRALDERLQALADWTQKRNGRFYQAAQAQKIVRDLENTDQIRTGPTVLQQWWANIKAAWSRLIERLGKAIFGAGKNVTPTGKMNIDDRWVQFFFYATVLSLLGVVGWLLWRHLGGRLGRDGARRDVRFVGGEDAELLVLPQGELRTRAQRFADEGNFREALRHRFIALLLYLDERAVWRYDARRTNWEHIGALRHAMNMATSTHVAAGRAPMIEPLSDLTRRFDRVRYGNAQASRDDWNGFDHDAATLEELANRSASQVAPPASPVAAMGARP